MAKPPPDFELPLLETLRSPQADIIEELIWSRLSHFWTESYDPSDLDALSAMYESMFSVLDAEYIRLFEINQSKSLDTTPVFTQRRWVRLDLNRYNEMKSWLQFLRSGIVGAGKVSSGATGTIDDSNAGKTSSDPTELDCDELPTHHAKHWHINFPWQIENTTDPNRGRIPLSFPIGTASLVEAYRIEQGPDGVDRGIRLRPKLGTGAYDFEILPDGSTIALRTAAPNDRFEFVVAFDFGGAEYNCFKPTVFTVDTVLSTHASGGGNVVQVPGDLSPGFPVHVLVVRNTPPGGIAAETNVPGTYATQRIFFPYGSIATGGVQHGNTGQIALPVTHRGQSFSLLPTDTVLVFGLTPGSFDTIHEHRRDTRVLDANDPTLVQLTGSLRGFKTFTPSTPVPLGLFYSVDFLGQVLQLFVNGQLIAPHEYRFEAASNTFFFKQGLVLPGNGVLFVDTLFTDERTAGKDELSTFHLHQECFRDFVITKKQFATFDDEDQVSPATFDDEDINNPATFDDYDSVNEVRILSVDVDPSTIQVFLSGILLQVGEQYTVSQQGRTTLISFKGPIDGRSVLVTFRRETLIFVYGLGDIIAGTQVYGIDQTTLKNMLSDLQNLVNQFESLVGNKISNLAALIEAAFIAAGGGNPLFALFHDEFVEYDGLPLDALDQFITALQARNIESSNTKMIDIPFMQDHVYRPTIRLESGIDFQVIDGDIQSSIDLIAPRDGSANGGVGAGSGDGQQGACPANDSVTGGVTRGSGAGDGGGAEGLNQGTDQSIIGEEADENPGVWWLPMLVLDESVLAKNFGAVVNDIRPSSISYKNSLIANMLLRFGGPVTQNIARSAAVMLGSPMFTQDSRVRQIYKRTKGYTITISASHGDQQQVISVLPDSPRPAIGMEVFTGQTVYQPIIISTDLRHLQEWQPGILIVNDDFGTARVGDYLVVKLYDEKADATDETATAITVKSQIIGVNASPTIGGVRTTLMLKARPKGFVARTFSTVRVFRDVGGPHAAFDGIVTDVAPLQETILATEFEDFILPDGSPAEYRIGDIVARGMPVMPGLATCYDDVSRPGWQWIYPRYGRAFWNYLLSGDTIRSTQEELSERFVSLTPPELADGYTQAASANPYPLPERGITAEFVEDNTLIKTEFTVVGTNGTIILLTPTIQSPMSGTITFKLTPERAPTPIDKVEYFELAVPISDNPRRTKQSYSQQAGATTIDTTGLAAFPAAGRVNILLPNGGMLEFSYYAKTATRFLDCVWVEPFTALLSPSFSVGDPGIVDTQISIDAVIQLVSEYTDKLLNPAFVSIIQKRDRGTNPITVSRKNADQLYELVKNTSAVLELRALNEPEALKAVLDDVHPAGTTLEVLHQHIFVDVYSRPPQDHAPVDPVAPSHYYPMSMSIGSPAGVLDLTKSIHVDKTAVEILLTSAFAGSGLTGQYYNNLDLTGLAVTRVDPIISFNWDAGSPHASIDPDTFSVRWTGQFQAKYSEYTSFHITADDGVRLYIDGVLVVDQWIDQSPAEYSYAMGLVAGQKYDIKIEYYENGGGAVAKLEWESLSLPREVIPTANLFPAFNSAIDFTYAWSLTVVRGSGRERLVTPNAASTRLTNIASGGEYLVRLEASNGIQRISTLATVRADQ